ncbi:MAG: hypothetical protein IKI35_00665, partial [Stomatobaculum sp.]|nr:hypothetical protein [Stomatobaculum sp.]
MYRVLRPDSTGSGSIATRCPGAGTVPGGEKDARQVSILACEFPRDAYCDTVQHLKQHGIHIADVTGSKTYDEFLTMSRSSLNLLFHKAGMKAAKDLEIRLKQPYLMMRPGYVYEEIDADLAALSERIGIPAPSAEETEKLRAAAEQAAADAAAVLKDTPVSVDGTAVDCPLGLCVYLLEHGFRVETLFVDNFTEPEEVFMKLRSLKPDLKVYSALNWNMRQKERGWQPEESCGAAGPDGAAGSGSPTGPGGAAGSGSPTGPGGAKIVAIGQRAAYFHDTNYFVDLVNNDGMYGYRGIVRLMELLTGAFREEKDMRRLIQIKGWGCSCG